MNTHDPRKPLLGGTLYLGTPVGSPLARLAHPVVMHDPDDGAGSGDTGSTAADDTGATTDGTTDASATGDDTGATTDGTAAGDEPIYALPEGYDAMSDEDLSALFQQLDTDIAEAKKIPEADLSANDVAQAKARRDAQRAIQQTLTTRIEERAQRKADMDALDQDVPTLPGAQSTTTVDSAAAATSTGTGAKAAAAVASQPASAITAVRDRATAPQADAVTDAAGGPANGRRSMVAAVAATQSAWISQQSRTHGEVVAWSDMLRSTKPRGGPGDVTPREDAVLAAARVEERNFDFELTDSTSQNERAMAAAMDRHREERAAAGGGYSRMAAVCDPATIIRTATVCGTDITPFQSSLVGMTATSGNALKFQYRLPTSIAAAQAGIGQWEASDQVGISPTNPATWKPCVAIACPGYDDETATEITACYEIDAFTELSSPEAEADFVQAKDRAFARFTEGWHLRKVDSWLHYVSVNFETGAVPDIIEAILTAVVSGEYGERLESGQFVVYGSPGVLPALSIDQNRKAFVSEAAAMDDVRQIVADATGTDYVQLLDRELASDNSVKGSPFGSFGDVGAETPTPMPRLKDMTFTLRVLDPSSIVRWDTGEAVFGDQITLDQARQNKRGFFQRIFGGQMKPGCAPGYKIDITVSTDGSRGGFVAPGNTVFTDEGVGVFATPFG